MGINLQLPKLTDLKPRITVIGVGGAGGNAINNMIASGLTGVEYIAANTDAQALATSSAERRLQLGVNLTEGLGAGSRPEIGEAAAEEAIEELRGQIVGSHMVFIAAGMGGGTGTGAAAVIARAARESGVLTVGIVTKPFQFEGARRMRVAETGIAELKKYVDTLIVIPNQNLFRIANEKTTFAEAFVLADQVLYSGVACIVDLIVKEGLINLDFADVRTVMTGMGSAMMGTGEATGEQRAIRAAEEAIANPLLDEISLKGARGLLLSIIGGRDMTLYEVDEAASRVRQEVDPEANIIVGATFDESMGDRIRVAIVASGLPSAGDQPKAGSAGGQVPPAQAPSSVPSSAPLRGPQASTGNAAGPSQLHPHAMQEPVASFASYGAPGQSAPPRSNDAAGLHSEEPHPPRASQELWKAPGGVIIEEGPLPARGPSRTQPPPLEVAQQPHASGFVPRPPEEAYGTPRRMPELNDFPAVGQRDYRAKADAYGPQSGQGHRAPPPAPPPPPRVFEERDHAEPPKRNKLFQRLTGKGGGDR